MFCRLARGSRSSDQGSRPQARRAIASPRMVKAILDHLGLPSTGPPLAPARFIAGPAEETWQDDVPVRSMPWAGLVRSIQRRQVEPGERNAPYRSYGL